MADMLIDQMMDDEWENTWYEPGPMRNVECRHCHKQPLYWRQVNNSWYLFSKNGIHTCNGYEPPIEVMKSLLKMNKINKNVSRSPVWDERLTIEEYGCMLSLIGKGRSEDCFTRTSGVAISKDKRVLGISYNGLKSGMKVPTWMKDPNNRAEKSDYYLHAEDNLFSLIKKGECDLLCLNISPCISCCRTIAANEVKHVVYLKKYHRCDKFTEFFKFYGIDCREMSVTSKSNISRYLSRQSNFEELL